MNKLNPKDIKLGKSDIEDIFDFPSFHIKDEKVKKIKVVNLNKKKDSSVKLW